MTLFGTKQCAECGTVVSTDISICSGCGGHAWKPTEASRARVIGALVMGLIILAIGALWFFFLRRS